MIVKAKIKLPATLENMPAFLEKVTACAGDQGLGPRKISAIELSMEEVLVNIINYAYPDTPGEAEVICGVDENGCFVIQIVDSGQHFDFSGLDKPDIEADLDNRKVGGLGVFLIKKLMDNVQYRRKNGQNILSLSITPNPDEELD
jgi:anti-sigma regulatory factor (Ser/Thr protein kinase)